MPLHSTIAGVTSPHGATVTSELAKNPSLAVHDVADSLYPSSKSMPRLLATKIAEKLHLHQDVNKFELAEPSQADLRLAASCGQFTTGRPSDLFLKMYIPVLEAVQDDPLSGLVSPPLLASTGVVPLSIISVIPDIIHHYANVIVQAEHEIFLSTNFWEASGNAETITNAFKELSRRAGERGTKIVVKLMYDRGTPMQIIEPHQIVKPKTYEGEKVKLPAPQDIPNIEMEVMNYHKPPVGTFHSKYMVVDRKIALLNSNNIQDRVNVEMMTHLEGPIVQSLYDMALLSWSARFEPPPPLLSASPKPSKPAFGRDNPHISAHRAAGDATSTYDRTSNDEYERLQSSFKCEADVTQHLNTGTKILATSKECSNELPFTPLVLHQPHEPFPMALVNRRPRGRPGHGDVRCPQNMAWLAGFAYATKRVFIQTPTFNAHPVADAAIAAVKRGVEVIIFADLGFNDEGELLPYQGGTNEMVAKAMYEKLETEEQKALLRIFWYTGKDQKTPLNASAKSRNCHVKLMIVDDAVGIQGNGNQDVQSWFHSQEINVMIDSPAVCKEWEVAIRSNQNTYLYGELDKDGIWRDDDGDPLPGATGGPTGPFKSLVGVKGAIQRVRGEGGF